MFNGCIIPYTPIAIDFFKLKQCPRARLFFLSNIQADQYLGLTAFWPYPIYCSPTTKKLLLHNYPVKSDLVKELELNEPHAIQMAEGCDEMMQVTVLKSNHCAGSVMFLFEGYFGRILYTGSFRMSNALKNGLAEACKTHYFDTVYLDNTFCSPKCAFPSRTEAMAEISHIIKQHPDHRILFGLQAFEKEEILTDVARQFNTKIVVSGERYEMLKLLDLPDIFTVNRHESRFHVVPLTSISKLVVDEWNKECATVAILPTALFSALGYQPFQRCPNIFVVAYSNHSSFQEMLELMSIVKPKSITPVIRSDNKDPLLHALPERSNMECFNEYLDSAPMKDYHIPPSILEAMNKLPDNVVLKMGRVERKVGNCYMQGQKRRKTSAAGRRTSVEERSVEGHKKWKRRKTISTADEACTSEDSNCSVINRHERTLKSVSSLTALPTRPLQCSVPEIISSNIDLTVKSHSGTFGNEQNIEKIALSPATAVTENFRNTKMMMSSPLVDSNATTTYINVIHAPVASLKPSASPRHFMAHGIQYSGEDSAAKQSASESDSATDAASSHSVVRSIEAVGGSLFLNETHSTILESTKVSLKPNLHSGIVIQNNQPMMESDVQGVTPVFVHSRQTIIPPRGLDLSHVPDPTLSQEKTFDQREDRGICIYRHHIILPQTAGMPVIRGSNTVNSMAMTGIPNRYLRFDEYDNTVTQDQDHSYTIEQKCILSAIGDNSNCTDLSCGSPVADTSCRGDNLTINMKCGSSLETRFMPPKKNWKRRFRSYGSRSLTGYTERQRAKSAGLVEYGASALQRPASAYACAAVSSGNTDPEACNLMRKAICIQDTDLNASEQQVFVESGATTTDYLTDQERESSYQCSGVAASSAATPLPLDLHVSRSCRSSMPAPLDLSIHKS